MGTCTIMALAREGTRHYISLAVPLKDAIEEAEMLKQDGGYYSIRIYSEGRDGNLTLIGIA